MATKSFQANVNKTVTVEGILYTLTVPSIPSDVHMYLNEVEVVANTPITLTENMTMTVNVDEPAPSIVTVNYNNLNSITYDSSQVVANKAIEVTPGNHTMVIEGATSIPNVTLNGEGITRFTVNSTEHQPTELPYTFQPLGGTTNSVYFAGQAGENTVVNLQGSDIAKVTVNGTNVNPINGVYKIADTQGTYNINVEGETYQVDLTSTKGANIKQDGVIIHDGTSALHKIIDIEKDTYIEIDATHTVSITGTDIKSISVNGVSYPIETLPINVKNNAMTCSVEVHGFEPSEVHVVGQYIDTVTVDGVTVPVGENGAIDFEITTVENNHFINIDGSQPREYALTFNNNDSTVIEMDGEVVENLSTKMIAKDVYIDTTPKPIPVHFESAPNATVQVNGRDYNSHDFTVSVSQTTEVDVTTDICQLTIDYGDDSFTIYVPQAIVFIAAPHRDGWIFDCWSSSNIGISNPKQVKTTLDLRGVNHGNLVCHYQRLVTCNKPNAWN